MNRRFGGEAAQRFAERRRREDEAPRLHTLVPELESLALKIEERTGESRVAEAPHTRRIAVEHAPALFFIPCRDATCKDGGHDLTHGILRALRARLLDFEEEDNCAGSVGINQCPRVLHYSGVATYR